MGAWNKLDGGFFGKMIGFFGKMIGVAKYIDAEKATSGGWGVV